MYEADTFWQLSPVGRMGLVMISGGMAALTLWGCLRLTRSRRWVTRLLAGLGCVAVFEWLAPQVHYLWYMQVIDGLPLQWVIERYPDPASVWRVLVFEGPASLSSHSRGALAWAVLAVAIVAPLTKRKGAA